MPCAPHTKVRRSEFTPHSSSCVASSPSSSSSSASDSSMESDRYMPAKPKHCDLSVYSDDVIQAQKYEVARQQIDIDNRPLMPRLKHQHCKDCNLYLDGRTIDRCGKGCCEVLWYRYGKLHHTDEHPVLMSIYMKQANGSWMLHKTYADPN